MKINRTTLNWYIINSGGGWLQPRTQRPDGNCIILQMQIENDYAWHVVVEYFCSVSFLRKLARVSMGRPRTNKNRLRKPTSGDESN